MNNGSFKYSGINNVRKIYMWLYQDATIFLHRKKDKFESLIREYLSRRYRKILVDS